MKTAIIHGALLLVMMLYGYRTWTRDKSVTPEVGSVSLWDNSSEELSFIEYKTENRVVRLEKRNDTTGAYWWGLETSITERPKPMPSALSLNSAMRSGV